jgi:hypothetical protein
LIFFLHHILLWTQLATEHAPQENRYLFCHLVAEVLTADNR